MSNGKRNLIWKRVAYLKDQCIQKLKILQYMGDQFGNHYCLLPESSNLGIVEFRRFKGATFDLNITNEP